MPWEDHHTWAARTIREAAQARRHAPENGQPLRFNPGDLVTYTNKHGIAFNRIIRALYTQTETVQYALGCRYLLDNGAAWAPIAESQLQPRKVQP